MFRCRYCHNDYAKNTEHVFPSGLGGQDVFINCVCPTCNGLFSTLEIELIQKSFLAFMRSTEGVKLDKNEKASMKAPVLLHHDRERDIIYEMGQTGDMEIFVRSQIIQFKDQFYIEGGSEEDVMELLKYLRTWYKKSKKVVTKVVKPKDGESEFVQFHKGDNGFKYQSLKESGYIKGAIIINVLPEDNPNYERLSPRIYIDDSKNLRIRSKSIESAITFICSYLNFSLKGESITSLGPERKLKDPAIQINQAWDEAKLERAVVKIGLNSLLHYFPNSRDSAALDQTIKYVLTGSPMPYAEFEKKNVNLDNEEKAHTIYFFQSADVLKIRLSFFSGSFVFSLFIPGILLLNSNSDSKVIIKYRERRNIF